MSFQAKNEPRSSGFSFCRRIYKLYYGGNSDTIFERIDLTMAGFISETNELSEEEKELVMAFRVAKWKHEHRPDYSGDFWPLTIVRVKDHLLAKTAGKMSRKTED